MKKLNENAYKETAKLAFYGGARRPVDCEGTYKDKTGLPIKRRNNGIAYLGLLAEYYIACCFMISMKFLRNKEEHLRFTKDNIL